MNEKLEAAYEELREIIDGGSESFTHDDAVQYLKDLIAKQKQDSRFFNLTVKVRGTNQALDITGLYNDTVFVDLPAKQEHGEPVGVVCMDVSNAHMVYGTQYLGQQPDKKTVMLFKDLEVGTQLYTKPQQRKPLELSQMVRLTYDIDEDKPATQQELYNLIRKVEAAHGIKE